MTYNNIETPRPVTYLIEEGFVEHNGEDYRFWFEKDFRDGATSYEFIDEEPGEDFDYDQFTEDMEKLIDNAELGE